MGIHTKKNKNYIDFVFCKGIMACFCQLFLDECKMTKKEKLEYIKNTLEMPWVIEAIQNHDDEIVYSKRINKILRSGNTKLIYITAKSIYIMQTKFNSSYQKIKHNIKKEK